MRADMLGPDCDRLWMALVAAERDGTRGEASEALEGFLAAAIRQPPEAREAFARRWCEANLDGRHYAGHGRSAPVRLPLVHRLVGSALLRGRARKAPDCARWLARLWTLLEKDDGWSVAAGCIAGPDALLDEALELNPADRRAHELRVRGLIGSLDYGLHELPWIVGDESQLRADLERLAALGPLPEHEALRFSRYVEAVRRVLEGDRGDVAIDAFSEAARKLGEPA